MSTACFHLAPQLPSVEEIAAYVKQLGKPAASDVLQKAEEQNKVALQPRCGVGDHKAMVDLLQHLNDSAAPDLLTLTIDSHTRLGAFEKAGNVLIDAPSRLNGYPLIAHGYKKVRSINEMFRQPIQVRHGSPDGRRLFAESLAAGLTSFEGGGISYNLPYCKDVPLLKSLDAWREIDDAVGIMAEHGVIVDREMFGSLTAVLVPPSISLSVILLEAMLAARSGCKCVSLAYPQGGNLIQDIASLTAIRVLCERYLPRDVLAFPVLHQFMGVFPYEQEKAETLIFYGGLTARLGRATKVITKTYQEAIGIPDPEVNAAGIRRTRLAFNDYLSQIKVDEALVAEELDWVLSETIELIDPVMQHPDLITGIVQAFDNGRLDIPFPANLVSKGKVLPVRDRFGAIRFAKTGSLPFSKRVLRRNNKAASTSPARSRPLHEQIREGIFHFAS